VPRQFAALHINGNRRPDREPLYGDTNPLKRSEDIEFMLNRLEEICEHDSKNLFGHKFFKENFWELLKFYWIYADDLIIDEQKTDQNKWSHIFPTYKKYRDIFNDHPQANDREYSGAHNMQPIGLLRQELNRTGSHQW